MSIDERELLRVLVFGTPAPQGSKRHIGGGRMAEASKRVRPWRRCVTLAAKIMVDTLGEDFRPVDGPVRASLVFTMRRPKRPRFFVCSTRPGGERQAVPAVVPDLDKLARGVLDGLTDAGVWADDARVIGFDRLEKVYVGSEDPDTLSEPGCSVVVRRA